VEEKMPNEPWEKLVAACYTEGIMLSAQYQATFGDITTYDVWGSTLMEVEVDILTGEYKIVRTDIIEDAGKSLSPEVDIGQIEGAFIMGIGLWTTEKLVYDNNTGELLTHNTWEYKVPLPKDIPEVFRVTMLKNAPNPFGVLASKATGEPPLCMSVSILFAIRNALFSARNDAGNTEWFQMDGPITPEDIQKMGLAGKEQYDL
jgi:xanthine dehydrogenase/oxidase